jgi:hypothetical protein
MNFYIMKAQDYNDTNENPSTELIEFKKIMQEQLRHYSFHNDHIMRGPLCRAMGLIDLLKRENLQDDLRKMLDMLQYEVRQMENVTFMISKMLDDHEHKLETITQNKNTNEINNNQIK